MSYAKAMRHWRNPRKWKKTQPILCAGHGSNRPHKKSEFEIAYMQFKWWWKDRNREDKEACRAALRECIATMREAKHITL